MATTAKDVATAAEARGWTLVKHGKRYKLADATTGTLVADDWTSGEGLTLAEVAALVADE